MKKASCWDESPRVGGGRKFKATMHKGGDLSFPPFETLLGTKVHQNVYMVAGVRLRMFD